MGAIEIITIIFCVAVIGITVALKIVRKRQGKTSCGCDCSSCSGCKTCCSKSDTPSNKN